MTISNYITRRQWQEYCLEVGKKLPVDWDGKFMKHPITGVTLEEVEEYCNHVGGRLLTSEEWQVAFDAGELEVCYMCEWTSTVTDYGKRVVRSGSWQFSDPDSLRFACRDSRWPDCRSSVYVFRCAMPD